MLNNLKNDLVWIFKDKIENIMCIPKYFFYINLYNNTEV